MIARPREPVETDRGKREALLHKMQQMMMERMIFAPIWQLASSTASGRGDRVSGWIDPGMSLHGALRRPRAERRMRT